MAISREQWKEIIFKPRLFEIISMMENMIRIKLERLDEGYNFVLRFVIEEMPIKVYTDTSYTYGFVDQIVDLLERANTQYRYMAYAKSRANSSIWPFVFGDDIVKVNTRQLPEVDLLDICSKLLNDKFIIEQEVGMVTLRTTYAFMVMSLQYGDDDSPVFGGML